MENLPVKQEDSLLFQVELFEHAQRIAKLLGSSTMIPDHFRNNLGNCVIALNYAKRVGLDPLMVMQKMYVIKGKPAVEAQLQIAVFNKNPRFGIIEYKMSGEGDNRQCVACALHKETNQMLEGPPVSIQTAKREGWFERAGSKWKTLPELMLRYRAATFFIRLYSPESTLGFETSDEVIDRSDTIDISHRDAHEESEPLDFKEDATIEPEEGNNPIGKDPDIIPEFMDD